MQRIFNLSRNFQLKMMKSDHSHTRKLWLIIVQREAHDEEFLSRKKIEEYFSGAFWKRQQWNFQYLIHSFLLAKLLAFCLLRLFFPI